MRTRFAPSPTGYLHVGGLRTALYAWLLAKQSHGQFLLRIEDTDQERFVPGAVESILKCLAWAGLSPDEGVVLHEGGVAQRGGHGPYIQSERKDTYRSYALELIQKGHAYYAFDTKEELDRMREEEQARGNPAPKYDWSVRMRMKNSLSLPADDVQRRLASGEPYVIRFLVPSRRTVEFTDDIRGKVRFESNTLDDQVLLKSDGHATYHLAHVVDDHHMQIDVVIRGEEWLPSLPKHLLLFEAFGWPVPRYAHVALLLNKDRTKLSKRTGSVSVEEYITKGYLPEALLNFIAMLGWNAGTTQELFSVQELIEQFSLDRVQKAGAIFDTEKLDWLQGQWIRRMEPAVFAQRILPLVRERFAAAGQDPHFVERAALIRDRIGFFHEAPDMLSFFYAEPAIRTELLASEKQKVSPDMLPDVLDALITLCEAVPAESWNHERLLADAKEMIGQRGWKLGQLLWPMRAALTGREFSPGAVEVADALGRDITLARLRAAKAAV